jgi:hypothetical protein
MGITHVLIIPEFE